MTGVVAPVAGRPGGLRSAAADRKPLRPPSPRCAAAIALLGFATLAQAGGDPDRGAAIVASRSEGLCVLCHAVPGQPPALQGTLAPPLAGAGARSDAATLRRRLLRPESFVPDTVMPAYGRTEGLARVAPDRRGQPLLTPAQVDDVVAYLLTLR